LDNKINELNTLIGDESSTVEAIEHLTAELAGLAQAIFATYDIPY